MKYVLMFKDTGEMVLDENTDEKLEFTDYEKAINVVQSFGHIGEEFIAIKEIS